MGMMGLGLGYPSKRGRVPNIWVSYLLNYPAATGFRGVARAWSCRFVAWRSRTSGFSCPPVSLVSFERTLFLWDLRS